MESSEDPLSSRGDGVPEPGNILTVYTNPYQPRNYLVIGDRKLYPFGKDVKPLFDRYVRHIDAPLSDYTFANNFIWLSKLSGFYQIIHDCFCLFSLNGNRLTMLLPPIGEAACQRPALEACFEIMDSYNASPYLSVVEYVYRDFLAVIDLAREGAFPPADTGPWLVERCFPDYIYRTADLVELKGNHYKTKRNEINQFRRLYPNHRMERLGARHRGGIRELINTWLKNRVQYLTAGDVADFFYTVELERQAIERALDHYEHLHLEGLCLFIDDRLEGFTFGERINEDVASVLVEKTNFAIPGSAQYLFREFAKNFADCTYINVGDDLGLENLRRVKMSYRPVLFGEKLTLRRKLTPGET